MEDSHCAVDLGDGNYFFGVFDGHAGDACAKKVYIILPYLVKQSLEGAAADAIPSCIKRAFLAMDKLLAIYYAMAESDAVDFELSNISGCTATCALVTPTSIYLINAGDSRTTVFQPDSSYVSTTDHKPNDRIERDRILAAGGTVEQDPRTSLPFFRVDG